MADSQHSHISWNDAVLWGLSIKKYIDVTHEGYTAAQKALMQIAVMYLLPSYQPDKTYPQGAIIRVAGKVYKALRETSESPVAFVSPDGVTMEANSPWQVLIADDVNDGNWAQLDLDLLINAASLPEQVEMALGLIREWDATISRDYIKWKTEREQAFADKIQQLEKQYASTVKTLQSAQQTIEAQRSIIDRQAEILDEFSRCTFLLDTYTPKS